MSVAGSERKLFLSLAHLQNEINFLLRAALWTSDLSSESEAINHGQVSLSSFFTRLLAGKLNEGWKLLKAHFLGNKALSTQFQKNAPAASRLALKELVRYFGCSTNLIRNVRNKSAFHYSPEELDRELESTPDELDLYLEKHAANSLYYFAEILANRAVLRQVGEADASEATRRLNRDVTRMAGLFARFSQAFMHDFLDRHRSVVWKEAASEVHFDGGLPVFRDVRIPFFADTSGGLLPNDTME